VTRMAKTGRATRGAARWPCALMCTARCLGCTRPPRLTLTRSCRSTRRWCDDARWPRRWRWRGAER
jgi:hypothetical protein